ncbi:MAG: S41 family peptidase, partial [SAR324 cluster bacterium]|nr:S41 family peptidase [SAR324 cluster bacterium]
KERYGDEYYYFDEYFGPWWPGNIENGSSERVVVLIDEHSASASEVTAAALKDHSVATFIGNVSYGKGVGQYVLTLLDQSSVWVTAMELFAPYGSSWHQQGITPDYLYNVAPPSSPDNDAALQAAIQFLDHGTIPVGENSSGLSRTMRRKVPYTLPWEGGTLNNLH